MVCRVSRSWNVDAHLRGDCSSTGIVQTRLFTGNSLCFTCDTGQRSLFPKRDRKLFQLIHPWLPRHRQLPAFG